MYLAANVPLVAAVFAFPQYHTYLWGSMGLCATAAIVVGIVRNRPPLRAPWILIAVGVGTFICGDITYDVLTKFLGASDPFPSPADVFYLATYPFAAAGLFIMVRARRRERDFGALLDSLVVTAGLAMLSWIYLIAPYVHARHMSFFVKSVSIAYPLGDILLLSMLARLLFSGRVRNAATAMLAVGGVSLLIADSVYGWIQLNGNWHVGGPTDLGWVAFYVLWGAAALHPSMGELTEKKAAGFRRLSMVSLVVLSAATLVPPLLLMGRRLIGARAHYEVLIAGVSALTFGLVMLRLTGLARSQGVSARREHVLRSVGEKLLGTTRLDEVLSTSVEAMGAIVGSRFEACMITEADGLADKVVSACPASFEGTSVRVGRQTGRPASVELPAGPPLSPGDGPRHWTVLSLGEIEGRSRQALLATAEPLRDDTMAMLEAVVSLVSLAVERVELARILHERRSEARFRSLVQNASDVILVVRANGAVSAETPSVSTVLGYPPQDVAGRTIDQLLHPDDAGQALALIDAMLSGSRSGSLRAEWRIRHADGRWLVMEVVGNDLSTDAHVSGVALTLRDVTERKQLEGELRHRAFHDGLTNLANRELFSDRVDNALSRSGRQHTSVAVLLLDLDDFKLVNDTFGHGAGDELLVQVGTRLRRSLRHGDTAARLGGDEFAVCAEFDDSRPGDVTTLAERILAAFADPFVVAGTNVGASATLGIAVNAASRDDAADLLRQADMALYAAKNAGKRTFRFFEPSLHEAVLARLEQRTALEAAITRGELLLHYQPIVELSTARIVGVEALVRWQHPERGVLPPSEFIDVAEESGLIIPLGRWVLDRACADLSQWRSADPDMSTLRMSVNVSPRQLHADDFVDMVDEILRDHGVCPEVLTLEITESVLLEGDDAILTRLRALQERGITFALDDFGTGYSSLSYLHQFPLKTIKIDRAFVRDMDVGNGPALIETIVSMGRSLGLGEVAEGIELHSQAETLEQLGCQYGQGYLFARPMPAAQLRALLGRPLPASSPVAAAGTDGGAPGAGAESGRDPVLVVSGSDGAGLAGDRRNLDKGARGEPTMDGQT